MLKAVQPKQGSQWRMHITINEDVGIALGLRLSINIHGMAGCKSVDMLAAQIFLADRAAAKCFLTGGDSLCSRRVGKLAAGLQRHG